MSGRWYLLGVLAIVLLAIIAVFADSPTVSSWCIIAGLSVLGGMFLALNMDIEKERNRQ